MAGQARVAILLAGGSGRRAGGPKQFRRSGGRTLLEWACLPFLACPEIGRVIVVVPEQQLGRARRIAERACGDRLHAVVAGGRTRHLSARAGLAALPERCHTVLIHDVARPFASAALIRRVLRGAARHGAAVPALELHDSVLECRGDRVRGYLDRDRLRSVQTPQGFRRGVIERAFQEMGRRDWSDDASVVVAAGIQVHLVGGETENAKITSAEELRAALRRLRR